VLLLTNQSLNLLQVVLQVECQAEWVEWIINIRTIIDWIFELRGNIKSPVVFTAGDFF
jgi:hypothetical protein